MDVDGLTQELQERLLRKQAEIEQMEADGTKPDAIVKRAVDCRNLAAHLAELCPDQQGSYLQLASYFESLKSTHLNMWGKSVKQELPKQTFWLRVRNWFDQLVNPKPWPKDGTWNPETHERLEWCSRVRAANLRKITLDEIEGLREL